MTDARFLQIHTLHTYPAALLNRDDAGLAKRIPFGGAVRARISSQCLKRHWRVTDDAWALRHVGVPMGVRTKRLVEKRLVPDEAAAQPIRDAVREVFWTQLYGKDAKDPQKRQALFFGEPEIRFLAEHARAACAAADAKAAAAQAEAFFRDQRANMRALRDGAGLESALFGRMVTSDPASNRDAAIHVAHALTVHEIERELDYMTVVEDLRDPDDDAGAAGLFDMELASGLYYGYVVVDVGALVGNLARERDVAARVVEHLLHLIATVSPGAKKGSTAPYACAEFMLVEAGERQPRTLANAYRTPIDLRRSNRPLEDAIERAGGHLARLDTAYGAAEARRVLNCSETTLPAVEVLGMDALAGWAADCVRSGKA